MAENDNSIKAKLEDINTKKDSTSTISFRLPTWLKAKVLEVADSKGQSPSGFSSFVVYKATMEGLVSQEDYDELKGEYESESNLHKKAIEDAKKVEKERNELKKKLEETKKEKDRLSKKVTELDKKLEAATQKSQKANTDKDKHIEKLRDELSQVKNKAKESENARKSEAMKREDLERRIKEANAWAERTPFIEKRF